MGFRPPRKVFRLRFEGTEYDGLEIIARATTVGRLLDIQELSDQAKQDGAEGSRAASAMIEMFADALVSWNLEDDDGAAIPVGVDGLRGLEMAFVTTLIEAWTQHQAGVSDPLAEGSTSGESSQVLNIPTEPLPASRAS